MLFRSAWRCSGMRTAVWLTLLFLCILHIPEPNHIRYLLGPAIIMAAVGTRYVPTWCAKIMLVSLLVFIVPLLIHPAFVKPTKLYYAEGVLAHPTDTYSWNPDLYLSNPSLDSRALFTGSITWVPAYPGFSAQYLFTSNAETRNFESFPQHLAQDLAQNPTEFVVFSGLWNINAAEIDVHLLEETMSPLGYHLAGTLLHSQVIVFQRNAQSHHPNSVLQRSGGPAADFAPFTAQFCTISRLGRGMAHCR